MTGINLEIKKGQTGFTLVEIMVYSAILAFVSIATFNIFLWSVRTDQRIKGSRETMSASRHAFDVLEEDIAAASGIYPPTSGNTQISLITTLNAPPGESTTFVDFFACGTNLCRKREGENTEALLPDTVELSRLRFIPISASGTPAVMVGLDIGFTGGSGESLPETATKATTTFALRAY